MENDQMIAQLATLSEQGKWIIRELSEVKVDVKEVKVEVKDIKSSHLSFKWKIVGASSVIGFLGAILVEFLRG